MLAVNSNSTPGFGLAKWDCVAFRGEQLSAPKHPARWVQHFYSYNHFAELRSEPRREQPAAGGDERKQTLAGLREVPRHPQRESHGYP